MVTKQHSQTLIGGTRAVRAQPALQTSLRSVCVCTCLDIFVRTENQHVTILVETNSLYGDKVPVPEFKGGVSVRVTVRLWLGIHF